MSYYVCEQCATGLTNDDWTYVDSYCQTEDETIEELARLHASIEAMGNVEMSNAVCDGYHDCFVCDSTFIGGYHYDEVSV